MRVPTPPPFSTLTEMLQFRASHDPDKVAFAYLCDGETVSAELTYRQLDRRASAIGAWLQERGAAGKRVLLEYPYSLDFVSGFFGCLYAGAVAVPVNPLMSDRQLPRLASIVSDAEAAFVLSTSALIDQIKARFEQVSAVPTLEWCASDLIPESQECIAPALDPDSLAVLQYTSGSTSEPKGMVLTHGNVLQNMDCIRSSVGAGPDEVCVSWLPLHHDMGLIGGVVAMAYFGGTSYLMPPTSFIERPMRWLERMSDFGATLSTAPNFAYDLCVESSTSDQRAVLDLTKWRAALSGGEAVRADTLDRFANAFHIAGFRRNAFRPVYGLAEATLLVTGGDRPNGPAVRRLLGSDLRARRAMEAVAGEADTAVFVGCGWPQNNHKVAIVDPDSTKPCAPEQIGEIWVQGPSVAQGYWRKRPATADTFHAFITGTDQGPFLRTGDLGFLHDGELYIVGRLKDSIVIRGANYYPDDIESTVQTAHRSVLRGRGAAFAFESPELGSGQHIVIVQEANPSHPQGFDSDEVLAAIRRAVTSEHELPVAVIVLVEPLTLPTTSSGKIKRQVCRQRFVESELVVISQWRRSPRTTGEPIGINETRLAQENVSAASIEDWVVDQLADQLGVTPAELDKRETFAYAGLDSVQATQLMAALGERLGRELSPTLVYQYPTVEQLAAHLADETADPGEPAPRLTTRDNADEPIAIVGMGCRFPGADTPEEFWRLLCDGRSTIGKVPENRWDSNGYFETDTTAPGKINTIWGGFLESVDLFDARFFGISSREAEHIDPQQRLLLEVAWEALEDAGQPPDQLPGTRTGVFVGISNSDYGQRLRTQDSALGAYSGTGNALSIAANRISYQFDLHGPSVAVDTACSSSLVAVHMACQSLRTGESTIALAGGVNLILSPSITITFTKAGVMAPDGRCKTFDARADGYVRSEGVGMVVLKPLSAALAHNDRIYAVIAGSAVNQDGRTNGLMAPSQQAQENVLRNAYRNAGVDPESIQYVEAHGTGTMMGDSIEAAALGKVLSANRSSRNACIVGSVKTNIGHLEAAAGIAGLIKVALCLHHRAIPQNLHFIEPNPDIEFDRLRLRVPTTLERWPTEGRLAVAGVSSFGFGGTNVHAVVTELPEGQQHGPRRAPLADQPRLLPLSARTPSALRQLGVRYHALLNADDPPAWPDLCYMATERRAHHEHRLAIVATSAGEAAGRLDALLADEPELENPIRKGGRTTNPRLAFVFSGQGSQWVGMARQLLAHEPVFSAVMRDCENALTPHVDWSLHSMLHADDADHRTAAVDVVQPVLFAVQIALAALWQSWGVVPTAVIGHSMGEVAAAHVAGALTLRDAAEVICTRARMLRTMSGRGAMAAVDLSPSDAEVIIQPYIGEVSIAALNGPTSTVLSGEPAVLTQIFDELQDRDIYCKWIAVDVASHSPQMDPLAVQLRSQLSSLQPAVGTVPFYSTVTGEVARGASLDADYWARNLREPVVFHTAYQRLLTDGFNGFVEISAHPTLLGSMRLGHGATEHVLLLPSLKRDADERATMRETAGALYCAGHSIDWRALHPDDGQCISAPLYPWQRTRHWVETAETSAQALPSPTDETFVGRRLMSAVHADTSFWEIELDMSKFPVLRDHCVQDTPTVPAAFYLQVITAALDQGYRRRGYNLNDISFESALLLGDHDRHQLQLIISGQSPICAFQLHGRRCDSDHGWKQLVSGTVKLATAGVTSTDGMDVVSQDPATIRSRCQTLVTRDEHYAGLAGLGLHYGPAFRRLEQIWRRDGEALAELRPGVLAEGRPPEPLDESIVLDAGFQVLAAAIGKYGSQRSSTVYLPVGVRTLQILGDLRTASWCHTVLVAESSPQDDTVEGDTWLVDKNGQPVAFVRGLRIRRIADNARADAVEANLDNWLYRMTWERVPLPTAGGDSRSAGRHWLILGDSELAPALRDRLLKNGDFCTLVCPRDTLNVRDGQAFTIEAGRRDDIRHVLRAASDGGRRPIHDVIHMWSLGAQSAEASWPQAADIATNLGAVSVLHVLQELTAVDQDEPPRLWVVTCSAQMVGDEAATIRVEQAPVWGFCRSIDHEYPTIRCTRIDVSDPRNTVECDALAREIVYCSRENEVALRGRDRYVSRLDDAPRRPTARVLPDAAFQLRQQTPGLIDDLELYETHRSAPAAGEVEIEVDAAALNFVDVLQAMGVQAGKRRGEPLLGLECSGTVAAVGSDVTDVHVGDQVVALASPAIASHVRTPQELVALRPSSLTAEQAAAVPVPFLTAYYALHELAGITQHDRVLIHAAAGGVGLAAVRVAQAVGADIFATAGSTEKRAYLRGLGIKHVFDSRSLRFADDIACVTDGQGVTIVLNSLAGEAISRSLSVLAPHGRFVEIGKWDIYENRLLDLGQMGGNRSYFAVDLLSLAQERPAYIGALLKRILQRMEAGELAHVPIEIFPIDRAAEAVGYMAQAKQIGKIVVSFSGGKPSIVPTSVRIAADAAYLVTGGLGGLGLSVASWLVERGARHLVLTGRSAPSPTVEDSINAMRSVGANVVVLAVDVRDRVAMTKAITSIEHNMPPLRGVIHAAGLLDDCVVHEMDSSHMNRVLAPKTVGTWNLHTSTQHLPLDFMVLFSSAAAVIGSPGQANYAAANAFLDSFAHYRRQRSMTCTSINWGPWRDTGLVTEDKRLTNVAAHGFATISANDGVRLLEKILLLDPVQIAAISINWRQWSSIAPAAADLPRFARLISPPTTGAADVAPSGVHRIGDIIRQVPPQRRLRLLEQYVRDQAARGLGVDPNTLDVDRQMRHMGLDSLIAIELKARMESELSLTIPAVRLLEGPSVNDFAKWLSDRFLESVDTAPSMAGAAPVAPQQTGQQQPAVTNHDEKHLLESIDELSDQDVDEMLRQLLGTDGKNVR
jgi:phthiocerol/phenolphthiocerol synthesis type-I polyketide synthase C